MGLRRIKMKKLVATVAALAFAASLPLAEKKAIRQPKKPQKQQTPQAMLWKLAPTMR